MENGLKVTVIVLSLFVTSFFLWIYSTDTEGNRNEIVLEKSIKSEQTDSTELSQSKTIHSGQLDEAGSDFKKVETREGLYVRERGRKKEAKGNPFLKLIFKKCAPFDKKLYLTSESYRKKYLSESIPGRATVMIERGVSVPILKRVSADHVRIERGGTTIITVQAVSNMPVSFVSVDMGVFENEKKAITVEADANGEASVIFRSSKNGPRTTTILCCSPVCFGRENILVENNDK